MTKVSFAAALAATAIALAVPAFANDSTATTGAGGLVLTRNAQIDMRAEDLFVSARQVRVRYVFRNTAATDQRVTVAFPLPDRNLASEEFSDVAFPEDFRTTVDGRPVQMRREVRAFVGAREITAELNRLGVPLTPGPNAEDNRAAAALARLPRREQDRLMAAHIINIEQADSGAGMERQLAPAWTVRETWSWDQTFPAGRDLIVEHQYTPGAGGSVGSITAMTDLDASLRTELATLRRRYCLDDDFLRSARALAARQSSESGHILPEQTVRYILTTGGNWRSPIGRFRLVVDKGDARNLVSFCGQGLRRISPTQFEMVRENWRPDRDLDVLIVGPAEALYPDAH